MRAWPYHMIPPHLHFVTKQGERLPGKIHNRKKHSDTARDTGRRDRGKDDQDQPTGVTAQQQAHDVPSDLPGFWVSTKSHVLMESQRMTTAAQTLLEGKENRNVVRKQIPIESLKHQQCFWCQAPLVLMRFINVCLILGR